VATGDGMSDHLTLTLTPEGISAVAGCYSLLRGWALERKGADGDSLTGRTPSAGTNPDTSPDPLHCSTRTGLDNMVSRLGAHGPVMETDSVIHTDKENYNEAGTKSL
jgi:hypothetical protein